MATATELNYNVCHPIFVNMWVHEWWKAVKSKLYNITNDTLRMLVAI